MLKNHNEKLNKTTVNWAQLSNRRYVDTDMLPGSYPQSSLKIYGLYARKHHIVEMRGNVTDAGRTNDDVEQLKIELLSQWKLEAESRNIAEQGDCRNTSLPDILVDHFRPQAHQDPPASILPQHHSHIWKQPTNPVCSIDFLPPSLTIHQTSSPDQHKALAWDFFLQIQNQGTFTREVD